MSKGSPEESAYTSRPCTPAMAAMFGYVNKMADPSASEDDVGQYLWSAGGGGQHDSRGNQMEVEVVEVEVAALGPASINLIDS
jgi:hypothetical protein